MRNILGGLLRNALAMIAYHWGKEQSNWDVICFREYIKDGKRFYDQSIIISCEMNLKEAPEGCPDVLGWEKYKSKLAPRKVDMSSNMDPTKLADAAVDLNLKLMRWRLAPDVDLETIKSTRCLLFGAGTLGCNVARVAGGIRKITFIDNSHVSYSNPVRQTLFEFKDCLQGGKPKALAAAEALKNIFPGVEAEGKILNIPMPGHSISENMLDQVSSDVKQIEELIDSHDVIFLLTDTRESRWLPTMLGAYKEKIVMNAALGYDTFLVMRHGFRESDHKGSGDPLSTLNDGSELGCYFCNDVVAPGNSVTDRTLDQQCTVTRPGVSYIASALVVEIMISILQHPKKALAPATVSDPSTLNSDSDFLTPLGVIPHQIRGYMDKFQTVPFISKLHNRCTACSANVLEEYKNDGFDFILKVLNDSSYLEEITGLSKLMDSIAEDEVLAFSDDEDF
ncbi:ubiquitin-like modifier-activating enzyme ATG7 [Caerostris extrusa]|uniref:Ubiquitin-like modifier-activating enzyme ATG7 n=1 Tax=Caerostris extrusa TaxID=172846 RepID=A0AAV4Y0Z1_CAEEX|nr:ubiquitin-like modifier-activating enzyme ATG7 [Caerostris extrusa]